MRPKAISSELRARIWAIFYDHIKGSSPHNFVRGWWQPQLRAMHVERFHRPLDEFNDYMPSAILDLRRTVLQGAWHEPYGMIEWILRRANAPGGLDGQFEAALRQCRSAYAIVGGDTITRIATDEETGAVVSALADTESDRFRGAHAHLKAAAQALGAGDSPASIRESISAVESVAKIIAPGSQDLGPTLTALQKHHQIHGALGEGFKKLYGFTSNEQGIRHALLDKGESEVDETDAIYMLGACASFVSYLIARCNK